MKCKFFGECENIVPQSKCCTNEQTVALSNALQTKSRFSFSYFRLILSKNTRIFIKKKKFFRSACNARTSINQPPAEVCAAADAIAATTNNLLGTRRIWLHALPATKQNQTTVLVCCNARCKDQKGPNESRNNARLFTGWLVVGQR